MLTRRRHSRKASGGFTLVEMVVVMSLITILTGLAVAQARDLVPRFRTRQASKDFAAAVELARIHAITNNVETRLVITGYDPSLSDGSDGNGGAWRVDQGNARLRSSSWTYVDGTSYDFSYGGGQYLKNASLDYSPGDITGPSWCSCTDSIVFSALGRVENPAADFQSAGDIRLDFVNLSAREKGVTDEWYVRIYRGGMVRVDANLADEYSANQGGTAQTSTY